MGHSDFPSFISRHFVAFVPRYRPCTCCSLPAGSVPLAAGPGLFQSRLPQPRLCQRKEWDLPSSWGTPIHTCPALRPRWNLRARPLWLSDAAFRHLENVGFHIVDFGAQSRGLPAPCLRFAAGVAPIPRKTRFRLPASFAGGDCLLPGFLREVSDNIHVMLSSPPPKLRLAHLNFKT